MLKKTLCLVIGTIMTSLFMGKTELVWSTPIEKEKVETLSIINGLSYGSEILTALKSRGLAIKNYTETSIEKEGRYVHFIEIVGDQRALLCNPVVSSGSEKQDMEMEDFNSKICLENLSSVKRYLCIIGNEKENFSLIFQFLKYSTKDSSIVTISDLKGNKLVVDPFSGIIIKKNASFDSNDYPFSLSEPLFWNDLWYCICQALGIPTNLDFWTVMSDICSFSSEIQAILNILISCTDCWTVVGCGDCIAGLALFMWCNTAEIMACMEPVVDDDGEDVTDLNNGQSVSFSVSSGEEKKYRINVPANQDKLVFEMTNVSADPDLYTRYGEIPTVSSYSCRPYYGWDSSETCTHNNPQSGYWYAMIRGYSSDSASGRIKATYSGDTGGSECTCSTILSNNQSVSVSVSQGEMKYFCINVPSSASTLTIKITGVSGDPDLYTRKGAVPTVSSYDCRPYYGSYSSETCTHTNPGGCWHIMIRGYGSGSCTLKVEYL